MSAGALYRARSAGEAYFAANGHKAFSYDPASGSFTYIAAPRDLFDSDHRHRNWLSKYAGKPAGAVTHGYVKLMLRQREVRAHRYVWFLAHGYWPSEIDHIDGDRANNRLDNLREVSRSLNLRNRRLSPLNTSGRVGVHWAGHANLWRATGQVEGRVTSLGYYRKFEDACAARCEFEKRNGFTKRHGTVA